MEENKKSFFKGFFSGVLIIIFIAVLFNLGNSLYSRFVKNEIPLENKIKIINAILDKKYVNEYDKKKVNDALFMGMLYGVGDPYTSYMTADEYKSFTEVTEGKYYGIGAVVSQAKGGGILIVNPYEGSPAKDAGLEAGDKILKINDIDITNMLLDEAISMMKGKEGTTVKIYSYRESSDVYSNLTIERKQINIPTVTHKILKNNIGLIRISTFERLTADQFKEAYDDLLSKGISGLIIDLRNNPGGLLDVVVKVADMIVPKGVIVYTEDKSGSKKYYNSSGEGIQIPLTVLVNGNSASASEVLSGAIKDRNVGTLVGEQTFGKALVQNLYPLSDGSAVKVTIAKYYTPSGASIHAKGIKPDYVVPMSEELAVKIPTLTLDQDVQLKKAIDVISKKIKN